MATVLSLPEQRVILRGVSWGTYENLLSDHVDASAPRFTFDRGVLEIMSPSSEHEEYNRTLALLVEVLAEELRMDIRNLGSTTFKREDWAISAQGATHLRLVIQPDKGDKPCLATLTSLVLR